MLLVVQTFVLSILDLQVQDVYLLSYVKRELSGPVISFDGGDDVVS